VAAFVLEASIGDLGTPFCGTLPLISVALADADAVYLSTL